MMIDFSNINISEQLLVNIAIIIFIASVYRPVKSAINQMLESYTAKVLAKYDEAEALLLEANELLVSTKKKYDKLSQQSEEILNQAKEEAKNIKAESAKHLKESIAQKKAIHLNKINYLKENALKEVKQSFFSEVAMHVEDSVKKQLQSMTEEQIVASVLAKTSEFKSAIN